MMYWSDLQMRTTAVDRKADLEMARVLDRL